MLQDYQKQFIELSLKQDALRFGEFTLKSGRISPYFFNAGLFHSGQALAQLGQYYAKTIQQAEIDYDILFGPAYKGIPLVATTVVAMQQAFQLDIPYCFNRKEAKDYGEGGMMVGAPLQGKVVIIDDVITAGTAIREAKQFIDMAGASLAGIVVALDRQERGQGQLSAIQELEHEYKIPVLSIIRLADLIEYVAEQDALRNYLPKIEAYRKQYGVAWE